MFGIEAYIGFPFKYVVVTFYREPFVTDCSSTSYPLAVTPSRGRFDTIGEFSCVDGTNMFYSNGTQPSTTQTRCNATAQWSGQDGLECWRGKTSGILSGFTYVGLFKQIYLSLYLLYLQLILGLLCYASSVN